jgi:pyrroloquinoline-quinone synthase
MTSNELWAQIEAILSHRDLLTHPYYQAWSRGELTHENLSFYAGQYYEHVSAFPTYLTSLHARLPEGPVRRAILANAIDEEGLDTGIHGRSHAAMWKQFQAGMAPDHSSDAAPAILPEMKSLVSTYRHLSSEATLPAALGALYAYESQVPRVASEKLNGLKSLYGADDTTCEYFALHKTADVHHSNVWHQLITECLENDPDCGEQVLEGVSQGAEALWRALDGIERERITAPAMAIN